MLYNLPLLGEAARLMLLTSTGPKSAHPLTPESCSRLSNISLRLAFRYFTQLWGAGELLMGCSACLIKRVERLSLELVSGYCWPIGYGYGWALQQSETPGG